MKFRSNIIASTLGVIVVSCTPALALSCKGAWDGQAATSFVFKDGKKVNYCFKTQCFKNVPYRGSLEDELKFIVGNGAQVTVKATGKSYTAFYRFGSTRSTADLRCR